MSVMLAKSEPAAVTLRQSMILRFNQKYLHLCSEDEQKSYGVGTT